MKRKESELINLPGLSRKLGLPVSWLKQEAKAGRLPCLKVGRRFLFNLSAVETALSERAAASEEESQSRKSAGEDT